MPTAADINLNVTIQAGTAPDKNEYVLIGTQVVGYVVRETQAHEHGGFQGQMFVWKSSHDNTAIFPTKKEAVSGLLRNLWKVLVPPAGMNGI